MMRLLHTTLRSKRWSLALTQAGMLFCTSLLAQTLDTSPLRHERDAQLWTSLKLERELVDDLSLSIEPAFRMDQNMTRPKSWMADVGLEYKLSKHIRFGGTYRYRIRAEGEHRSRVNGDIQFRQKVERFTVRLRSRVQRRFEQDQNHTDYFRQRLKVSYNIRKKPLNPFASTEWFYHLWYRGNQWESMRFDIGMEWKVIKRLEAECYYRYEREFNVVRPELNHILGLGLKYEWK